MLYDLIRKNGLHLEPVFRQDQAKWQVKIAELHKNLSNFELENCGQQTFSKAFECLIDNILVRRAVMENGVTKTTVTDQVRKVEQAALLSQLAAK